MPLPAIVIAPGGTVTFAPTAVMTPPEKTPVALSSVADDTGTTDMSTADFAGASGANLLAVNNRGALVVWCEFADPAGSATVEVVFYDDADAPLFVSEQVSFVAKSQRMAAAGDYLSQAQLVDTYGASQYRPFLRTKGTGNVDIYAHPV